MTTRIRNVAAGAASHHRDSASRQKASQIRTTNTRAVASRNWAISQSLRSYRWTALRRASSREEYSRWGFQSELMAPQYIDGLPGSLSAAAHSAVSVDDASDGAENRSFLTPAAKRAGRRCNNTIRHAAERQRLEPYASGTSQCCEEHAFAAEQRRLDPADEFDVVVHRRLEPDNAARVDAKRFTRSQRSFHQRAAR